MQFEIEVPYTCPLSGLLYVLWDQSKNRFLTMLLIPLCIIPFIGIQNYPIDIQKLWIFALILCVSLWIVASFYLQKQVKLVLEKLAGKPLMRLHFTPESVRIISGINPWEIQTQWKGFYRLKKLSDVWILCMKIHAPTYFAIPTNLLTVEQQEFILAKLKENQVKIC